MLKALDGREVKAVPHQADFKALVAQLGATSDAIRDYLDGVIDNLPPDGKTGKRTFGSGPLGSKLSPWPEPLLQLYHRSRQLLGPQAREEDVQDRAALWFGLFVWERIMQREGEEWVFYDPNLTSTDPNREVTGKVYFER